MQLNAGCELQFEASDPTPLILMLRPRSGAGQWIIREEYQIIPAVNVTEFTDMYGNLCQRVVAPPGPFSIHFSATVQTANLIDVAPGAPYTPVEELPDDVLHFTLPSRYCQSDQMGDLAAQIINGVESGYDQAEAIRKWIHDNIKYQYGTSDASTSAMDTADKRVGVCRDFTHLGISLCRALNIRPGWSLDICTSSIRWIFTPGSKRMWMAAGLRSMQPRNKPAATASPWRMAAMPPMWRSQHSLDRCN